MKASDLLFAYHPLMIRGDWIEEMIVFISHRTIGETERWTEERLGPPPCLRELLPARRVLPLSLEAARAGPPAGLGSGSNGATGDPRDFSDSERAVKRLPALQILRELSHEPRRRRAVVPSQRSSLCLTPCECVV
ncbi:MAG: hypothetical protein GF355_15865 [Candidatus Eisenbacteria bacterium]|nr:hypothetical protein [Candidatus Eisenbacteria bacterium]